MLDNILKKIERTIEIAADGIEDRNQAGSEKIEALSKLLNAVSRLEKERRLSAAGIGGMGRCLSDQPRWHDCRGLAR